jgi:hypothetical protein
MRNSKCAILSILISAFLLPDISGQIPGVVAGWNASSMVLIDQENPRFSYHSKMGFNAGATLEIPVLDFLSAETGILLVKRGHGISSTENFGGIDLIRREEHELYNLDFPLVARLRFNTGKFDVFASAGPYLSYGLSGKIISSQIFGDQTENEIKPITWGNTAGADYKRTDYGFIFSTGFERGAFNAGISYVAGESDISPVNDPDQRSVLENRQICILIGYKFGKAVKIRSKKTYVVPETVKPAINASKILIDPPEAEEECFYFEKLRATSLLAMRAESERLKIGKGATVDSIAALRIIQIEEKTKADSIAKATEQQSIKKPDVIVYRVQFASSVNPKGSYEIEVDGNPYQTWEYIYSGAHRSTAGEFSLLKPAVEFRNALRKAGYPQAFVVVFRNGIRTNEPAIFK